jgi:Uma2 family endonuclease
MATASQRQIAPLSVAAFRSWMELRPDEEHWELIDGVAIKRTPPTRDHRRITSNLERLLNDAIERLPQSRMPPVAAYQRIGVNLEPIVEDYDPEPDVAVVEVGLGRDPRYADRFFLVAEVVSQSDEPKIARKCEVYKRHPDCDCLLVIRQDRYEITVDRRGAEVWAQETLSAPDDQLSLPPFGLQCSLKDIYKGTTGPREPAQKVQP